MLQFPKKQKIRQTVKLTLYHRPKPKSVDMTCSASSIERTKPPAYLFRYQICQRARDKNQTSAPYHLRRARPTITSDFVRTTQRRRRPIRPAVRLSAAGEGVSTATNKHPQPLFAHFDKKNAGPARNACFLRAFDLNFWGYAPCLSAQVLGHGPAQRYRVTVR